MPPRNHAHLGRQEGIDAAAQDTIGEEHPGDLEARYARPRALIAEERVGFDLLGQIEIVMSHGDEQRPGDRAVEPDEVAGDDRSPG